MPKTKVESVLLLKEDYPILKDRFGNVIEEGDIVCYPVRDRHDIEMYLVPAKIRSWDCRQVIEANGELGKCYFVIRVWVISEDEKGNKTPKRTAINENRRMLRIDKNVIAERDEEVAQLCTLPIED